MKFFFGRVVRMFKKIARSSKCDFRNLEQKWDRYRWSIFFRMFFFFVEKNPTKNVDFFGRTFLVENVALQCKSLCKGISLYKGIYIVKPNLTFCFKDIPPFFSS